MRYAIGGILAIALIMAAIIAPVVGLYWANSEWNCRTWHANTGEQTRVMAAECYVKEPRGWVLFDTHIKNHHVEVSDQ